MVIIQSVIASRTVLNTPNGGIVAKTDETVSLSQLEKRYDVKSAIESVLSTLPPERLIQESDMAQRAAGGDRNRFRWFLDTHLDAFKDNRIKLRLDGGPSRWYWGTVDTIKKARVIVEPWE
jgi:hypothetical protein